MEHDVGYVDCDLHKMTEEHTSAHSYAGYVLITCGQGDGDSRLDVRMSYQGDPFLISYLLENGAERIFQDMEAADE